MKPVSKTEKIPPPVTPGRVFVTPRARTAAGEKNIELSRLTGSGPDGLIIERDVLSYIPPVVSAAFSWHSVRTDMTEILKFTERHGNVTPDDLILMAVSRALIRFPIISVKNDANRMSLTQIHEIGKPAAIDGIGIYNTSALGIDASVIAPVPPQCMTLAAGSSAMTSAYDTTIDSVAAAQFLAYVRDLVEHPSLMMAI